MKKRNPTNRRDAKPIKKRLLVIDDEKNMRHMLRALLEKAGYIVETAVDGETGLACIQADEFDFVLCDSGRKYRAYIAGMFTQRFGSITYELGIRGGDRWQIGQDIKYEKVEPGTRNSKGHLIASEAKAKVKIIVPINNYREVEIPARISCFHWDDDFSQDNGWFDCLHSEGVITEVGI